MSGGHFLVQKTNSLKIKMLAKEDFDVSLSLKVQEHYSHAAENLFLHVNQCLDDVYFIQLGEESKLISDSFSGFLRHRTRDVLLGTEVRSPRA